MPHKKVLKFTNYNYQLKTRFTVYSDFESYINADNQHIPSGFALLVVDEHHDIIREKVYSGENTMTVFFKELFDIKEWLDPLLNIKYPLSVSHDQEVAFQNATHCHICNKPFTCDDVKVRDHNHRLQYYNFRGAAHHACNLSLKETNQIPVVFHNLKNYDGHLIMQELGKHMRGRRVRCIAQSIEKYITFSIDNLRFIDSFAFLPEALSSLVEGLSFFRYVKDPLLQRKGVFPYQHFTSLSMFEETSLPPKEAFYNSLTQQHITNEDYDHAKRVWEVYNIQNMKQFHDKYMLLDTLLLAEIYEQFRDLCLKDYKLDPTHMVSLPALTWNAALKMTGVELEHIRDPNIHLFIEAGIRGGVIMISKRYARANNKYLKDYDPQQASNYIMYLDCNSLYSTAMCEPLPVRGFKWVSEQQYKNNKDDKYGFVLEVDLEYGKHLHDYHNCFPLAPEKFNHKLTPNLNNKQNYIVHYKTLELYLQLGLRVTKCHRVLQFEQEAWLKPYIEFNIWKRQQATSKFDVNYYKTLNNACYGKTMLNKRKHINVQLVREDMLAKKVASSRFDESIEIDNGLHLICLRKPNLILDSPIYLGMTILDISKAIMYDFYYNHLKKLNYRIQLLITDTDSLIFQVWVEDFYQEMKKNLQLYDTSNYPKDHPLYSAANKKKNGKMKDELAGAIMYEVVGLRPKLYSFITDKMHNTLRAKGVAKATIKTLSHQQYMACLQNRSEVHGEVTLLQSKFHRISTITQRKKLLSSDDDKRHILDNNIDTLAFGHYKLSQ